MSVYQLVDLWFVSRYVGPLGIAAIGIVTPIIFLISSFGMAVGIGGASIISRALGAGNPERAKVTFGNQTVLTVGIAGTLVAIGALLQVPVLNLFGSNEEIMPLARSYFTILLVGIPFLAWAMMSNNVIRAQGRPKTAMYTLLIPAISNIILDWVFISVLGMGIAGAGWATTLGYTFSAIHTLIFFLGPRNELTLIRSGLRLQRDIIVEMFSIGMTTLARQGSFSVLAIVLNNTLDKYGGSLAISEYGLIRFFTMFVIFPVLGIMQGFMPIAGYNYGAMARDRVRAVVNESIRWSTTFSLIIFGIVIGMAPAITGFFTQDPELLKVTPYGMRVVFFASPLLGVAMISSAYFQAIGKAREALNSHAVPSTDIRGSPGRYSAILFRLKWHMVRIPNRGDTCRNGVLYLPSPRLNYLPGLRNEAIDLIARPR